MEEKYQVVPVIFLQVVAIAKHLLSMLVIQVRIQVKEIMIHSHVLNLNVIVTTVTSQMNQEIQIIDHTIDILDIHQQKIFLPQMVVIFLAVEPWSLVSSLIWDLIRREGKVDRVVIEGITIIIPVTDPKKWMMMTKKNLIIESDLGPIQLQIMEGQDLGSIS